MEIVEKINIKNSIKTIDPRAQLIILILINLVGMTNSNAILEIISFVCLMFVLIWQGMLKKSMKYALSYLITWVLIFISMKWQNQFTSVLTIFGVLGRKTIPLFMFASSIITNTKIGKLIAALQEIRVPKGMTISLAVAVRFFPTLKEEYYVVINSMKMRGLRFPLPCAIRHPILVLENILVPLMLRTTIIADELSMASYTRGINSEKKRSSYYLNRFSFSDGVFISIFLCLSIMAIGGKYIW